MSRYLLVEVLLHDVLTERWCKQSFFFVVVGSIKNDSDNRGIGIISFSC